MVDKKHGKTTKWRTLEFFVLLLLYGVTSVLAQTTTELPQTTSSDAQELTEEVEVNVVATVYTLSFSLVGDDKDKYFIENVTCRTGTNADVVANEKHICENLDPCSHYISVVTFGVLDESLSPPAAKAVNAYTEYKQPTANITSLEATATTIMLTWDATDRACISRFEITAKYASNTLTTEQLNDKSTYTFRDRLPCQTNNITMVTFNNASMAVHTDWDQVDTTYLEPGDLKLEVTNSSNGDTVISWGDPESSSCISLFTFKWKRIDCEVKDIDETTTTDLPITEPTMDLDYATITTETSDPPNVGPEENPADSNDVCEWTATSEDPTLKQYTLTDLQGCELHAFEIYINSNLTAKGSLEFASAEKLASAVDNPSQSLNATDVSWMWSPPKDHAKCVASYKVNLTGPMQRSDPVSVVISTQETFVLFENLDPCGLYNVEIAPVVLNGSIVAVFQNQSTVSEDQPSGILEPVITPEAYSLNISWLTPAYADLCIDGYRLSGWMDDGKEVDALSVTTQSTNVTFNNGLLACQAYTIQIIPYTRENLDGELRQVEVETQAAVVDSSQITLELTGSSSHSLTLNARNLDYNNMCQTIFAHFTCSADVPLSPAEKYVEGHSKRVFQAVLGPLSPYSAYACDVILYNVAGSTKKSLVDVKTLTYFPDQPTDVQFVGSSEVSLEFRWSAPTYLNGPIKFYQTYLMRHEPDYFVPETCSAIIEEPLSETKGADSVNFTQLSPAIKYMMQVAVQNEFGLGQYTSPVIGITNASVPDVVTDLKVHPMGPELDNATYRANVTITWTVPCKSNGKIEWFVLDITGSRPHYAPVEFTEKVGLDTTDAKGRMSHTVTQMEPEYNYNVKLAVKNFGVETMSASVDEKWKSPAGIPSPVGDDMLSAMRVNAQEMTHPTSSAIVRLPSEILTSESGTITYIALLLSQKGCSPDPILQFNILDNGWPQVASYDDVYKDGNIDCILQYQTTPERWEPEVSSVSRGDLTTEEIVFYIGIEKCPNASATYCNGPLKADTEYNMVVRLFTDSSYSDAAILKFKTDAAIKVTLILVSVCCCLLVAFVLGLAVLWIRKRIAWHRDSGQGIEDPFGNVIAKNFAIFYDEVAKPEKIAREFKEITVVALELSYSASELGTHKNRYADIYPYDKNRVILDIDAEGSDYINASFIDGHTRRKEYIATQGPKPESVMDFWRMVLQHSVRIIVQVTQYREGNTIKCHEYYPFNSRGLVVTVKSKESFELYDRTELCVVHDKYGLKEKVIHFHFKKWPDHGCPEDPMHLIAFVKKVKSERRPNYSPIVVHCSAGVGRTGTFIGLDLIMQRLKSESKINIFETVKKLRFQRMKMVQTLQQYTFLYACTYELVKHKIPRVALKQLDRRPISANPPPVLSTKKVSFPEPDVTLGSTGNSRVNEEYVSSAPDPELGLDVPTLRLPPRTGGLRKINDTDDPNSISSIM